MQKIIKQLALHKFPLEPSFFVKLFPALPEKHLFRVKKEDFKKKIASESQFKFCSSSGLFGAVDCLDNFLGLIAAIMLEKSIVCYGDDIAKISGTILGLESLLRPF